MLRSRVMWMFPVILAMYGCGGDATRPAIATVTGVVTLDGTPLENATVLFQPENGRPSSGITDKDGRYTLSYAAGVPGAAEGAHTVYIRTLIPGEDGEPPVSPEKLPAKYHDESGLRVEVKSGANTHDFPLTAAP